MTDDLTPEALVASFRAGACGYDDRCRDMRAESGCSCAQAADTITALLLENEALEAETREALLDFRRQTKRAEAAEAKAIEWRDRATAAEAALAAATTEGQSDPHRFAVISADFSRPFLLGAYPSIENAIKAQCGSPNKWPIYERRILAALEPNPAAQDREALVAASARILSFEPGYLRINPDGSGYFCVPDAEMVFEDDRGEGPDGPEGSIHWIAKMDASEIVALRDFLSATQPQTDALAARLQSAARLCDLSPQEIAEGDWGPEGQAMAQMLKLRILNLI